jgi:hypothetical protein
MASLFAVTFGFLSFSGSDCVVGDELGNGRKPAAGNAASHLPNLYTPSGRAKTFVDSQTREKLESIPIPERPNRPLHFYGNAIRRRTNATENRPSGGMGFIRR